MLSNQHNATLISTTRLSSIYVNLFTHKGLVIKNITSLISNKETVSLAVFSDKNTFYSGLEHIEINKVFRNNIKNLYFINKKSAHNTNVIKLAKDIRFLELKNQTKLILLISDSYLASLEKKDIIIFFKLLNNIAHKKNLAIQLCLYGSLVQSLLKPILITMSHLLAGLTSTTTIDEQQSHVFVDYWANQFGVESNQQYRLSQTDDH